MRDIKFRAWNGDAMEYGGFSVHATSGRIVPYNPLTQVKVDSPLMQYTGLKDKNGKEIYEGDIVEHGEVRWSDCAFCLYVETNNQEPTRLCQDRCRRWEIIGNIHESPELLEAK
tara:strand:- start:21950 stop:22291 length:342 start_codon:yes stop_codon:yes gene_type:complete